MTRLRAVLVLAVMLLAPIFSAPSRGETLNVGTVRATVISSVSDCPSCSPLARHGCYVVVAAPDQLVVGIPSGACDSIPAGSCFEATGEVTDDAVAEGFPFGHIQLAAHLWTLLPSDYCAYE